MTDRLGFVIWPALAILAACAITRPIDVALAGQPSTKLTADIATIVEWRSAEAVAARCAYLQFEHNQLPLGAHGCAYVNAEGYITLVLPRDLHPLISHELGHARDLHEGRKPDHDGWRQP